MRVSLASLEDDDGRLVDDRADRRVDEADSPRHGVEEELVRRQALEERVLDKAPADGAVVVLGKVRQGSVVEAVGDALAVDGLLAETGDHLHEVQGLALGAALDHV